MAAQRQVDFTLFHQFQNPFLPEQPVTHPQDRMLLEHRIVRQQHPRSPFRRGTDPVQILRIARIDEAP